MELFIQGVGAVGLLLAGVGLVVGAIEFRRLIQFFQTGMLRVLIEGDFGGDCCGRYPSNFGSPGGHAVYIFTKGEWVLHSNESQAGYEPVAPEIPGAYEGHVLRTVSVLKGQSK